MNFYDKTIKIFFQKQYNKDYLGGDYLRARLLAKYFSNVIISENNNDKFDVAFIRKKIDPPLFETLKEQNIPIIFDVCDTLPISPKIIFCYQMSDIITVPTENVKKYLFLRFGENYGYKRIIVTHDICEYNFIQKFPSRGNKKVFIFGGIENLYHIKDYIHKFQDCLIFTNYPQKNQNQLEEIRNLNFPVVEWKWDSIIEASSNSVCSAIPYIPSKKQYKSCNRILLSLWLGLPVLTEKTSQTKYFLENYPDFVKDIESNGPENFDKNISQEELRSIAINCKYGFKESLKTWEPLFKKRDNSAKRKVIYTVSMGKDYPLENPPPNCEGWDKIAIVEDMETKPNGWELRPIGKIEDEIIDKSHRKRSRYPKMNPHLYFPDYDISLYIDTGVTIGTDLNTILEKYPNDNWVVTQHPKRKKVVEEIKACLFAHRFLSLRGLNELAKRYNDLNFHEICELSENAFILRHHNEKNVIKINNIWWNEYRKLHIQRDQLIFSAALWVASSQVELISKAEYKIKRRKDPN